MKTSLTFFVGLAMLSIIFLFSCKKEGVKIVGDLEGIVRNEFGQPIEGALIILYLIIKLVIIFALIN